MEGRCVTTVTIGKEVGRKVGMVVVVGTNTVGTDGRNVVGNLDGRKVVGSLDGRKVVGICDVGNLVGFKVGDRDGNFEVGTRVGLLVGDRDGLFDVGRTVGRLVGETDGLVVGANVGSCVLPAGYNSGGIAPLFTTGHLGSQ